MRVAVLGCIVLALACSSPASKPAPAAPVTNVAPGAPPQPAETAKAVPERHLTPNEWLDEFADRSCACKDAACGQEVMADFLEWAQANKDAEGDEARAGVSVKRMQDCITALIDQAGGGAVAPPPPAEGPGHE